MTTMTDQTTVGQLVTEQPGRSRVFERLGIDFCCGGKVTLTEACQKKQLDVLEVLGLLQAQDDSGRGELIDVAVMSMADLADHIEQTHHAYLRQELPRINAMAEKVANVHGDEDARLREVSEVFKAVEQEMTSHMYKEEQILFPMVRQLDSAQTLPSFHCGQIGNPIAMMEHEHEWVGQALEKLSGLTDGYAPPEWACNTYRALLDALAGFEADTHQHVHKENNVLFPRAIAREAELRDA